MAGWGRAVITPRPGTPLVGFSDRQGRPSTGVHDELFVKALVLSDGDSSAAIIGSDMLIVPENVADIARARSAAETGLKDGDILFNASHTHSGPGAFAPGPVSTIFAGAYEETVADFLSNAFAVAVLQAVNALEPASLASGSLAVPDYIRNRARDAAVDPLLDYLRVRREDGDEGYMVRYSAHPTVLGGRNMAFSADFPGYLQRRIEDETGGFALYLGGAVGSMGPRAPMGRTALSRRGPSVMPWRTGCSRHRATRSSRVPWPWGLSACPSRPRLSNCASPKTGASRLCSLRWRGWIMTPGSEPCGWAR
jgi:neutral ceramidase